MVWSRPSISRREFLKLAEIGGVGLVAAAVGLGPSQPSQAADLKPNPTSPASETALKRLLEGNQRFVRHRLRHPDQSLARLREVAQSQHPFATILSCADSRVAAEIVFDQGLGDLFDVRVAGNIVTPEVVGSLEYAAALLETPLLMVLGHERCGAVTAAVQGERLPGQVGSFVKAIKPALAQVKGKAGDPVDNAVVANIQYQIKRLQQTSPLLKQLSKDGKLAIVGARYDLDTGAVALV
ncbi:carbonic anhydrase [Leptolyngbya sp. FACHB-261]|uniref:carbonic anhydrase n=1 Tax=Leptolyngbya sp. FACHB-261 TaxID=2692806 RepID=UPI00168393BE|nr:carbonic anhydrase [Leptolyngbya sp. FACHB-261]MBD2100462.1 carbonic anhydrase [Leptolyngbya sp. FACHB-261]